MRWLICLIAVVGMTVASNTAEARLFGRRGGRGGSTHHALQTGDDNSTAQGVANIMARRGICGHFGGNSGYEGCGAAGTWQAAYNNCCFANSGMTTIDYGYAKGSNGMWYCCRRYR